MNYDKSQQNVKSNWSCIKNITVSIGINNLLTVKVK